MDPRAVQWTVHYRIVSLGFLVGVFKTLHGTITQLRTSNDLTIHDIANVFEPASESRDTFWKNVILFAEGFMQREQEEFNHLRDEAKVVEDMAKRKEVDQTVGQTVRNNILAEKLSSAAVEEICGLFNLLYDLPVFERKEVQLQLLQ
jgi:hypothetical protein